MAKPVYGTCCLCGAENCKLSFEHVPPEKAYNDFPQLGVSQRDAIELGPDERPSRVIKFRKGIGANTLCASCNNSTGGWYGAHFVRWCYRGKLLLERSDNKPTLYYPYRIFPLSVIKQIATMFMSVNGPSFSEKHDTLVRFILNPEAHYLPPAYRFFVYYNITGLRRRANVTGTLNVDKYTLAAGKPVILSEITHPPFGYVLTLDSAPPDDRLREITYFARYFYNEISDIQLRLSVLPTYLGFPGDYRTKEEIYEQANANSGSLLPVPDRL